MGYSETILITFLLLSTNSPLQQATFEFYPRGYMTIQFVYIVSLKYYLPFVGRFLKDLSLVPRATVISWWSVILISSKGVNLELSWNIDLKEPLAVAFFWWDLASLWPSLGKSHFSWSRVEEDKILFELVWISNSKVILLVCTSQICFYGLWKIDLKMWQC